MTGIAGNDCRVLLSGRVLGSPCIDLLVLIESIPEAAKVALLP